MQCYFLYSKVPVVMETTSWRLKINKTHFVFHLSFSPNTWKSVDNITNMDQLYISEDYQTTLIISTMVFIEI